MKKSSRYEIQVVREALRKAKAWDKNEIEKVLTIELTWKLRRNGFYVKPFLQPIKALKALGRKGQPWYFYSIGEVTRIHPLQPEIDIFCLELPKDPIGFPKFYGFELKYFEPTARDLNALFKRPFHHGLGESLALLSLGLNYASLWHFFDHDMLNKFLGENYAKMIQYLISSLNLPIGYKARWVKVDRKERKVELSEFEDKIDIEPKPNPLLSEDIRTSIGILVDQIDPLRLSIIREALNQHVLDSFK